MPRHLPKVVAVLSACAVALIVGCSGVGGGGTPAPTLTLNASRTTIALGESVTLTWASTNATSVVAGNFGATTVSGTKMVSPTQTTTYTLTVRGAGGDTTATAQVTVTTAPNAPTVTLTASKTMVNAGDSVTLTWTSTNATAVVNSNFGATAASGSTSVTPAATITYSITVGGEGGQVTATVEVTVVPPGAPTVNLTASKTTIVSRETFTLTWTSTNATFVVSSNFGAAAVEGTLDLAPTVTHAFTITVGGAGGQATASVTVIVAPAEAPTLTLTATPQEITHGAKAKLTWVSTNANAVVDSSFGTERVSGSAWVTPPQTTTYSITVRGPGGQATAAVTVTVLDAPDAPTVTLNASATMVNAGDSVTLTWTSTNATTVVNSNFGAAAVSGSTSVTPSETTTYSITVGGPGGEATDTVEVIVVPPGAPTVNLSASKTTIASRETVTLTWNSTNATTVVSSNFGATAPAGALDLAPTVTHTFTITVSGAGGEATASVTVTVAPAEAPTLTITATPQEIVRGDKSKLTWVSTNATAVVESNLATAKVSGSVWVAPEETTTYSITVSGPGGQAGAQVTVTVRGPAAPTVTLTATPSEITPGQSVTLAWTSTNAVVLENSSFGAAQLSGQTTVAPSYSTAYSITVSGPGGEATAKAVVTVSCVLPGSVSTVRAPGKVVLPEGAQVPWSDLRVGSMLTFAAEPDLDGGFNVLCSATLAQLVTVWTETYSVFALAVHPGSLALPDELATEDGGLRVDALSSAVALVFMNPAVVRSDPEGAARLMQFLLDTPEVRALATVIEQVQETGQSIGAEDSAAVRSALEAATGAAINALLAEAGGVGTAGYTLEPGSEQGGIALQVQPGSEPNSADLSIANSGRRALVLYYTPEDLDGVPGQTAGPVVVRRATTLDTGIFRFMPGGPSVTTLGLDFSASSGCALQFSGPGTTRDNRREGTFETLSEMVLVPYLEVLCGLPFSLVERQVSLAARWTYEGAFLRLEPGGETPQLGFRRLTLIAVSAAFGEIEDPNEETAEAFQALRTALGWSGHAFPPGVQTDPWAIGKALAVSADAAETFFEWAFRQHPPVAEFHLSATGDIPIIISSADCNVQGLGLADKLALGGVGTW